VTKVMRAGTVSKMIEKCAEKEKFVFEAACTDGKTHKFVSNRRVNKITVGEDFTAEGFFRDGWFIVLRMLKGIKDWI